MHGDDPFAAGAAYVDGRFCPIGEAAIPLTHWGYRRSDATYDVVGLWDGAFFRLDDHLRRFRASPRRPAERKNFGAHLGCVALPSVSTSGFKPLFPGGACCYSCRSIR